VLRFADRTHTETSATFELFHLFAVEASWTLEVALDGAPDRLALEGRVRTPALPGPSELVVWYVDAPTVITLDGEHGTLSVGERALDGGPRTQRASPTVVALAPGRVRIHGPLELEWHPLGGGSPRPYAIELDLEAALIT
jgi:hypothetical protein